MRALIPLKMRWCCQITIDVARDDALLDLMAAAGCALALIGFESLDRESLVQMRKKWNGVAGSYDDVIRRFHARGIMIYGTFVFGYDADTPASFERAAAFAREQSLASPISIRSRRCRAPGSTTACATRAGCCATAWWLDPSLPLRRRDLPAARHDVRRAVGRTDAGAPRLLRLGLDRAARAARRAAVARPLQDRDHAARQLDLAARDRAQAGPSAGDAPA